VATLVNRSMKYILIILSLLALTSCGGDRPDNTSSNSSNSATIPSYQVTINQDKTIQELKQERDKLKLEYEGITSLIKEKELERVTFWSKLIGGISLGLATVCLVASFFLLSYPFIPFVLRTASYILAGVGFLSFTVSLIYPYLIPIGFGTLFVILVVTGIAWYSDRKSLKQVVKVVENTKHHIPDYKRSFRQVIDTSSDKWINKIRKVKS
jgi:hypothetical protein